MYLLDLFIKTKMHVGGRAKDLQKVGTFYDSDSTTVPFKVS